MRRITIQPRGSRRSEDRFVGELVAKDEWTVASGVAAAWPWIIRFRRPVLLASQVGGFSECLRVVWSYAEAGMGAMPDSASDSRMAQFEEQLCSALEGDGHAALTAVLTLDGARQWVMYTTSVPACGKRINQMPQETLRYPIELDAFSDPEWDYLRNTILANVSPDDWS